MFKGSVRPLKKRDVESVEKIFDLYWHDDFRKHLSEKLKKYIENDPGLTTQNFKFFVAEENGEVVGVAAMRKAPEHMREYTTTNNPAELYVVAVKEQGKGIGSALRAERLREAKAQGYTEAVFFSGETHQDSWKFHDSFFKRAGPATAPNGEKGFVWHMVLQ